MQLCKSKCGHSDINLTLHTKLCTLPRRRKRKKGVGCGSGRHDNYESKRRDCGRIRIWDPGIKIYFRYHIEDKVVVKKWGMIRPRINVGCGSVTAWVAEGERMVLCYVQGSGRRKRKKGVSCGSGRQENYGSDGTAVGLGYGIPKSRYILDITLRTRRSHTLKVVLISRYNPNWVVSIGALVERASDPGYKKHYSSQLLFIEGYCSSTKKLFFELRFMASDGSDQNARYALSKLLQRGTLAEYENANEDIGVVEVSSAIDNVFDIGESNVESIEVRSEFSEFSENKESLKGVVVGGGELDGRLDEINLNLSEELADNGVSPIPTSLVAHESPRVRQLRERIAKGGRMVLCYIQGNGRRKRKKDVGCGSGRQENYESERQDCGKIRIWDPGIKIYFRYHLGDKVVVKE
nr:hypothetical protein [Tanacetum cinerariifolium]